MRKGLQVFGDQGLAAIKKVTQKFHNLDMITPITVKTMTKQQKSQGLVISDVFEREERWHHHQGPRLCQWAQTMTVDTERTDIIPHRIKPKALFLSCIIDIDAKERRDVSTADVPGAFLQTKSEGEVIIRVDRQMAMQLARINPKYAKDIMVEEKGQIVIYGKANKALYDGTNGILNVSLLFWKDLPPT